MTTAKSKPRVFTHAAFVLVRRADKSVDVCDPLTSTWATFKTERHAKWSATVFSNLSARFGHQLASEFALNNCQNKVRSSHHD